MPLINFLKRRRPLLLPNILRPIILDYLADLMSRLRRPELLAEMATYAVTRLTTPAIREYFTERFKGKRPLFERFTSRLGEKH